MKIENCGGDDQVVSVDKNVTFDLTKKCEIVVKGCGKTTGFKTMTVGGLNEIHAAAVIFNDFEIE